MVIAKQDQHDLLLHEEITMLCGISEADKALGMEVET